MDRGAAAQRVRAAYDLFEAGEQMMRTRLRREHPQLNDDELDARIRAWLSERPGAEFGDSAGKPSRRFIGGSDL